MTDRDYMLRAIELAKRGIGWTNPNPVVGAVIVKDGRIIGEGYHRRCGELHAERNAVASLTESAKGAAIYVTLEPCPMCAGAIINSRIPTVVYGAKDALTGSCGSVLNLFEERYGHKPAIYGGVLKEECARVMSDFFQEIREK